MNPKLIVRRPQKKFHSSRKKNKENIEWGIQSTYIALLGIIGFLLIYYVWTLNASATQGFEVQKLENIQAELKNDLNRLESTISELESLNTIMSDEVYETMEQARAPEYLVIRDDVQYVYNY